MGFFDNLSGSPLAAGNPQFSSARAPDFSISLDIGKSSGFGLGLFPLPIFGDKKPLTQAEWALKQFSERLDKLRQDFGNSLHSIINPQQQGFDPTKFGMTDYALQFLLNNQGLSSKINLETGLALSKSGDAMTLLLGKTQVDQAVKDSTSAVFGDGISTVTEKQSFGDKFAGSAIGKNFGAISAGLGMADTVLSGILGEKSEYNGPKGDITRGMDEAYDTIQQAAGSFGPIGLIVSLGMQANKMLGNVANKLGGGTSGKTTIDAIMGSSFMQLTPFGLVNGFGGKKADTITKDDEAFALAGSSYTGTGQTVDSAVSDSGAKYGLFSNSARKLANDRIAEARRQLQVMAGIVNDASNRFNIRNSMSAINGNRRRFEMQGGYDLSAIRVGRNGLSLKTIATAKRILSARKYKKGGVTEDPFDTYFKSLPKNLQDSVNFRVKDYWEFNGKPKDFEEAVSKGMFTELSDGWHANSVAENPLTGEIEFMKSANHPTHYMEVDWYNSDDAAEFRGLYELQKTEPYWKYVKKKPQGEAVESYKEGGILEVSLDDIPEEYLEDIVLEVTLDSILPEFREGGKVNVIPDGALHARLHHMENADNLTKKGIPVVTEKEGGELEQQAEIERDEIIFRLEVTKKLEELRKKFTDTESSLKEKDAVAIEAGKLLVEEILNNTVDNTGLLNTI